MILGLIDLEANYLVVKAYQYTTLTSIQFSGLYLLSFFTILIGLVLYSSTSTYIAQDPRVYKQFRNPSGAVVDLPTTAQVEPSVTYTSLGQETEEEPHVRVA
ncbi:Solute carrier family 35 member F1 [Sciurus carolinensis]|uniref:Solute carrier family 35 member F1 n=1 Tax=Sciurus carolinensis TaxID=30640 RepID=A0AA41N4N8_SCICA|nr:Solute carrier family 35 member F1 [Sciurus carolinensis]